MRLPRRPEQRIGLVEAIGHAVVRAVGRRAPLYSVTWSAHKQDRWGYDR
jgi:hypothetical protein